MRYTYFCEMNRCFSWSSPNTCRVLIGLLSLIKSAAIAQLSITYPTTRIVFQRNTANEGYLNVAGLCPAQTNRIEARLLPATPNQGQATAWTVLDPAPERGRFGGRLLGAGGWYRVEVRAWRGSAVVAQADVQPVGIGEVFIIAGQSNGQGLRDRNAPDPVDQRVVCAPHFNLNDTIQLPLPFVAAPVSATGIIGPRGLTAWNWGRLGDWLTARLNVPVLFYNVAWSGTSVRNWRESIRADSTATSGGDYFRPGMPYGNLKRVLQDYVRLTGVRAVLWHQGEAEFYDTDPSAANYMADLRIVILQSRADAGFTLPWVVARASMDNNLYLNYHLTEYAPVINAQNQVIQQVGSVYTGPNTDGIQMPRTDAVHFSGDGLRQVGDAWNAALTDVFFQVAQPLLPADVKTTDLSLRMTASTLCSALNAPVRFTVTIDNTGVHAATNVWLRCNLPQPLVFMSGSGVTHQRGLLLAKLPVVSPGAPVSVTFIARPAQEGNYQLAAEIARADQLDSDSQPNTSTGDGQDDLAQMQFRTHQAGAQVFTVPVSVNADPLPPVASNQPAADPNRADLKLSLTPNTLVLPVGQVLSVSLTVANAGGRSSGSVRVGCSLPAGLSFMDGPGMSEAGGLVTGTVTDIGPTGSTSLWFRVRATQAGRHILTAQIETTTVSDPDSQPNNGYANGEDDTAQIQIRVR